MIPELDIIIVNWNAGSQLRRCLESVASFEPCGYVLGRVVVVDNGSVDGSLDGLYAIPLPLEIIRNSSNRGFAAACNQGAHNSRATYLLFLNPDTVIGRDSLAVPIRFMEGPESEDVGICGIQLLDENGEISRSCARFPTPRTLAQAMFGLDQLFPGRFRGYQMRAWTHDENKVVDHVIGAFYLVRKALFDALGGFDELFFVYLEDLDFSLRAKQAGWRCFYLSEVQAFHCGGGTSRQIPATRLFYSLQSRVLYGGKHFGLFTGTLLLLGILFGEAAVRLLRAALSLSVPRLRETVGAYLLLWRHLPKTMKSLRARGRG